jgi:tripartite-type tricarboxylate transporter receptor subunit TctC
MHPALSHIKRFLRVLCCFSRGMGVCLGACFWMHGPACSQDFPNKPIHVLTEYSPGSGGDVFFRALATQFSTLSGQTWVVDNRPGAGAMLAVDAATRAAPDGYTVLVASQNVPVTRLFLSKGRQIDANVELTPISALWRSTLLIVSNVNFAAKSLKELIALAKANPGQLAYTTSGIGTQGHFAGAGLELLTGTQMVHVPYTNGRQVMDVIAGQAPFTLSIVPFVLQGVKAGQLRVLAVAADQRLDSFPGVPTVAEIVPKFEPPPTWTGIFGPPGLPKKYLDYYNDIVQKGLANPALKLKASTDGFEFIPNSGEQFSQQIKRDIEITARLARAAKIQPND